jgi:AcrR family transcriptional regulator
VDAVKDIGEPDGAASQRARKGWTQDPDGVRRDILEVAREEFVAHGLAGARVDAIAARTSTSKRMLYYYFGGKDGLYQAVIEEAYSQIRKREQAIDVKRLPPVEAIRVLAGLTFDHHAENPDFVRLVMIENIHQGRHLKGSRTIAGLNLSAIDIVRDIYVRGVAAGVFRPGLEPFDIHLTISALAFYNVSNRASIREVFGHDMGAPQAAAARRLSVMDTVERFVRLSSQA